MASSTLADAVSDQCSRRQITAGMDRQAAAAACPPEAWGHHSTAAHGRFEARLVAQTQESSK